MILAGVSISLVLDNNGVIQKSKEARNKYGQAKDNEQAQMNELENWMDKNVNGDSSEYGALKKQITNDETETILEDIDKNGEEDLVVDFKVYEGAGHTVSNIKKLEILSGNTTKNVTFENCQEIIIYSDAKLDNVIFSEVEKIVVYSGAELNYCSFDLDYQGDIKITGAVIKDSTFRSNSLTFENCTLTKNSIESGTTKYINCIVDGEPYSN